MAFSLSGSIITQSGGSSSSRDTPQGIINAGYGTLTATRTITIGNYHLQIDGFYEDTGWTYIFPSGRRMIAGATCNWVSGYKTGTTYFGGASFNIAAVGSSDVAIANAGATLYWYGVTIDNKTYPATNSRMVMNTLNSASEVVLTMKNPSYLVNNIGNIALFELDYFTLFIRHGVNVGRLDKFLHVSTSTNNIYNNVYAQDIIYNNYQPVSTTNDSVNFFSTAGTRNLVLNNPLLDTTKLRIYRNNEVIRINEDLNIEVNTNLTQKDGVDIHAFTQDGTYQFPLASSTDTDGKVTARLLNVWRGNGNTASAYNVPSTIVDRRAVTVVFAKYGMEYLTADYNDVIGNGAFSISVFRASDTNVTETNEATVDAYTSLDDLKKVYDFFYSKKIAAANIEIPTIDSLICSIVNMVTDFANVNVDVNDQATASDISRTTGTITAVANNGGKARLTAAAHGFVSGQIVLVAGTTSYNGYKVVTVVDTNTFDITDNYVATETGSWQKDVATIKATTLVGDSDRPTIKSNGLIRTINSAGITAGLVDSQGDSFLTFTHNWELYSSLTDRNASTNLVASGTTNDNYRFDFLSGTTYYLWVDGIKREVTPIQSGSTAVDLTIAGLFVGLQSSVDSIESKADTLITDTAIINNNTQH